MVKTLILILLFCAAFFSGKVFAWYYNSKYYGVDGKAEAEKYMSEKYGQAWRSLRK